MTAVRSQHNLDLKRRALMNARGRILVVLSLVLASSIGTVVTASPADRTAAPATSLPLRTGDDELLGSWSGTIRVDGVADPFDGGYIAIERLPGDRFGVTVGPEAGVRYTGTRLERTERGVRFEVTLPAFETRLLAYDVSVEQGAMTGTVTFVKYRLTQPGQIAFVRR
jgi:hypothetical protein